MSESRLAAIKRFYKADRRIELVLRVFSYLAGITTVLMAILATSNIIVQKGLHGNISSANDYVTYLFVATIYTALPHVQLETDLTSVDLVSKNFSRSMRLVMSVLNDLLGLAAMGFVAYAMYTNVYVKYLSTHKVATVGATGTFQLWPFALLIVVSMVLTALTFIWNNVRRCVYGGTKFIPVSLCRQIGVEPPRRFGPPAPAEEEGGAEQ